MAGNDRLRSAGRGFWSTAVAWAHRLTEYRHDDVGWHVGRLPGAASTGPGGRYGLLLAFGAINEGTASETAEIGHLVKDTLERHDLVVAWNDDPETRLEIPEIDWKRRGPRLNRLN